MRVEFQVKYAEYCLTCSDQKLLNVVKGSRKHTYALQIFKNQLTKLPPNRMAFFVVGGLLSISQELAYVTEAALEKDGCEHYLSHSKWPFNIIKPASLVLICLGTQYSPYLLTHQPGDSSCLSCYPPVRPDFVLRDLRPDTEELGDKGPEAWRHVLKCQCLYPRILHNVYVMCI